MFAEVRDSTATTGAYFRSSGKPIRGAMAHESDRAPQNLRSDTYYSDHTVPYSHSIYLIHISMIGGQNKYYINIEINISSLAWGEKDIAFNLPCEIKKKGQAKTQKKTQGTIVW